MSIVDGILATALLLVFAAALLTSFRRKGKCDGCSKNCSQCQKKLPH